MTTGSQPTSPCTRAIHGRAIVLALATLTALCASGCVNAERHVTIEPYRASFSDRFVDEPSGIAFQIPDGHTLVRIALAGGEELLGEYNFPMYQLVTNDVAFQHTRSGHDEVSAEGLVASVVLATNEWLNVLVSAVPSDLKHESQFGPHAVTVLEQSPTPWGDQTRTYVLMLSRGHGMAAACMNDVPESADRVVHSLLGSVQE